MENTFARRTMLAKLAISAWTAAKKDRAVTAKVHRDFNAASGSGNYKKTLIDKRHLAGIQSADSALRAWHEENTLPWAANGQRILPTANHEQYTDGLRPLREAREKAVAEFLADYPAHVSEAETSLNGMFNAADYPSPAELARLYSVRVEVWPFPDAADFRVDLADGEVAAIRADIERRAAEVQAEAIRDLWKRLAECLQNISARLSTPHGAPGGGFKDSLVGNLRALVEVLPRLNVTGDPNLEAMRREAEALLVAPQTLREVPATRRDTANQADALLRKMAGFTGGVA